MDKTNRSHNKQNNKAQKLNQDTHQNKARQKCRLALHHVPSTGKKQNRVWDHVLWMLEQNPAKILEKIQNCIFRMISGSPITTPIKQLNVKWDSPQLRIEEHALKKIHQKNRQAATSLKTAIY